MGVNRQDDRRADLEITVEHTQAGTVRCILRGDVDLASSARLQKKLDEIIRSRADRLDLDLRGVDFFDSSGLNLLLRIRTAAEAAGIELTLVSPSTAVARVFEITGAGAVFSVKTP